MGQPTLRDSMTPKHCNEAVGCTLLLQRAQTALDQLTPKNGRHAVSNAHSFCSLETADVQFLHLDAAIMFDLRLNGLHLRVTQMYISAY